MWFITLTQNIHWKACYYDLPTKLSDPKTSDKIPLSNNSILHLAISFKTQSGLSSIYFEKEDVLKIIRNLNINKAHGHDNILIWTLKICDSVLVEPLSLIYKNCINSGVFPDIWKRSHIIPTYKKKDKHYINNYHPVSLLPICGKIFECILYNPLFLYLESNDLLTPHQSGFCPNDSYIYQLLSIVHGIYADFDHNSSLEVRVNFADISKAFNKVWLEDLLYKLESIDISENLNLFCSFLNDRYHGVVIWGVVKGQHSDWALILAGVPEGSILGPLIFFIYINDLPDNLNSLVKLLADVTSLFSMVHNPTLSAKILNDDLSRISKWVHFSQIHPF